MRTPITLNLYDRETQEVTETLSTIFVPFNILKASLSLSKRIAKKAMDEITEEDIDAIAALVKEMFPSRVTLDDLLERADLNDMVSVLQSINARGVQSMDPTLPPKARKR